MASIHYRHLDIVTPLTGVDFKVANFYATEALSELFEFRIEAVSETGQVDFSSAIGKNTCVHIITYDQQPRYYNGIMTEARWAGHQDHQSIYEIVLRPWMWFLTRTSNSKIFWKKTVIDIIKDVFQGHNFSDVDVRSTADITLEYCVQYRETDFNFLSRLMEEYGIYYFFEHTMDSHKLVLVNSSSQHKDIDGFPMLDYIPLSQTGHRKIQYVESWARARQLETGVFKLKDYDYNAPKAEMLVEFKQPGNYERSGMEMFDYPGDHAYQKNPEEVGTFIATVKLQAMQSLDERRESSGGAPCLFPGALITLQKIPTTAGSDENKKYLVTRCSHFLQGDGFRSGDGGAETGYSGHYGLTPSDRQFRAPLVTRKPEISGFQSAKVIPEDKNSTEEIDVDALGRVLVFFYWDREAKYARRVRVAQIWAGSKRGALFTPRIGDEVIIAYEEGDPDRPIVVGSVYNGTNTVSMTLPDKKVKSGILTQSSKGGAGYNMLLFDDTAGSEVVKLRCQNDLMVKALNDETRVIGGDQSETITGDVSKTVQGNETINIGSDGGQYSLTATQKITLTVGGSSITMDPSSITLHSPTIKINGDTVVTINSG